MASGWHRRQRESCRIPLIQEIAYKFLAHISLAKMQSHGSNLSKDRLDNIEAYVNISYCSWGSHWKRPCCWERLRAREEGVDRGWDGWMTSSTQWTWVWASCRRWWRIGKPGGLQPMGSKRDRHDLATEQVHTRRLWFSPLKKKNPTWLKKKS